MSSRKTAEERIERSRETAAAKNETISEETEKAWALELAEAEESGRREAEDRAANGVEEERHPRIFTIKRIDKARAEVYLDGLHVRPQIALPLPTDLRPVGRGRC